METKFDSYWGVKTDDNIKYWEKLFEAMEKTKIGHITLAKTDTWQDVCKKFCKHLNKISDRLDEIDKKLIFLVRK